jgi:hypothetical protein
MEDLGEVGDDRFEVTVIASPEAFDAYLGTQEPSGMHIAFLDAQQTDPGALREALAKAAPDLVLITPSPATQDLRASDAGATLATLHVLQAVDERMPVLAELFLPESANRLPDDPRLLGISGLRAVAVAVALNIFDAPRAAEFQRQLAADAADH